ncbi:MAG TPA: hypothetical protein VFY91_17960 [Microbacterium sp.]|nr:hypothetical protein [Microbacterium sp.]
MKKTWKALAGTALAASLVIAPMVTTGAAAADEPVIVGVQGTPQKAESAQNSPEYWEEEYAAHGAVCYSHQGAEGSEHGTITNGGLTVTLKPYQQSWYGDHWEVLVIKAGNTNNVTQHPQAGVAYASPVNSGNQQAVVSHWIICKGDYPEVPPKAVVPSLTFSEPSCLEDGFITFSNNVTWTELKKDDGSSVWTAVPLAGEVLAAAAQRDWPVPNLTRLPADHELCDSDEPEVPETKVEYTSWVDGEWACGDTTVTQTRQETTTVFALNEQGAVVSTSSTKTETQDRDLTQDEIAECPLLPGAINSVCVGDVPHLGYAVTLPEGYTADSSTPLTITFVNPDGENYVVENQPLSGSLLWPGASDAEPKMWPGWALVDGEYVETDGNFAWTREGVTVEFAVNPTYETLVTYPEATALCANPPAGEPTPTDEPGTPGEPGTPVPASNPGNTPALAVTGGSVSPVLPLAAGATLLAGMAILAFAAYRRRVSAE